MLTEKQIKKLESMGAKRWQKGEHDRLYINSWQLPGVVTNWKNGGKKTVSINGEELSYTKTYGFNSSKNYIDVKTGDVVTSANDRYYADFIVDALKSMVAETEEKEEVAEEKEGVKKEATLNTQIKCDVANVTFELVKLNRVRYQVICRSVSSSEVIWRHDYIGKSKAARCYGRYIKEGQYLA